VRYGHGSTRTARLARHQLAQGCSVRAPSSSANREGNVDTDMAGSRKGALRGLSRMMGNYLATCPVLRGARGRVTVLRAGNGPRLPGDAHLGPAMLTDQGEGVNLGASTSGIPSFSSIGV